MYRVQGVGFWVLGLQAGADSGSGLKLRGERGGGRGLGFRVDRV